MPRLGASELLRQSDPTQPRFGELETVTPQQAHSPQTLRAVEDALLVFGIYAALSQQPQALASLAVRLEPVSADNLRRPVASIMATGEGGRDRLEDYTAGEIYKVAHRSDLDLNELFVAGVRFVPSFKRPRDRILSLCWCPSSATGRKRGGIMCSASSAFFCAIRQPPSPRLRLPWPAPIWGSASPQSFLSPRSPPCRHASTRPSGSFYFRFSDSFVSRRSAPEGAEVSFCPGALLLPAALLRWLGGIPPSPPTASTLVKIVRAGRAALGHAERLGP
jgi:hypothetical protein